MLTSIMMIITITVSYTHLDVYKRQVSTHHMTNGNLIVNGSAEGKPTSFAVDTGATVSIVCPDLISKQQPQFGSCTIQTVSESPVKVLRKVDVHVCSSLLEFNHQMLVADIIHCLLYTSRCV